MVDSAWAILLCKFNDDDREPYARSRYEELFTSAGVGKLGMVDYFADMSHGKLDLSGSKVFGWWTLDKARSDFRGAATDPGGRNAIIDWARAKAASEGVDLNRFHSVVVCLNVDTDLFGSSYGVCCDDGRWPHGSIPGFSSMSPSILGQEMGHGYNLNHSRIEGGDDYTDPWDIMSTAATDFMSPHPIFSELDVQARPVFRIGPGLNAANMSARGWLDQSRIWSSPSNWATNTEVELRPLHRRDLPGTLAIRFGDYFIEFRMNDRWDAAIPEPCVLIHRLENGISYLLPDNDGKAALTAGSFFGTPPEYSVLGASIGISVRSIDADRQVARIGLVRTKAQIPRVWPKEGPYRNPGIAWLEDSATLDLGDRFVIIPRMSPYYSILETIAALQTAEAVASDATRDSLRLDAFLKFGALADRELQRIREPRSPARQSLHLDKLVPPDRSG